MDFWFIFALILLVWNFYELIKGQTTLHRVFYRTKDTFMFWVLWILWFFISLMVLTSSETFILYIS